MPDFVWARVGGALTIVGTHLHRPSRDPWLHERQVSALAQFVRRIDGPLILAGDLNYVALVQRLPQAARRHRTCRPPAS